MAFSLDSQNRSRWPIKPDDRDEFHHQMAAGNQELLERALQKDYFQGRDHAATTGTNIKRS